MSSRLSVIPIFILAALSAIAPLAIDAYLPAMPSMAEGLNVSIHAIELSLSLFLAAFAVGQIIGGPFSDHYGRRRAIFFGVALFVLGSAGIIFSGVIHSVWMFRVIQALGAGLMAVNSAAVIRDLSDGQRSARYLSHIAVIMMMAPLIAPLLGMGILQVAPWQGIFLFLLLYALALGVAVYFRLPETRVFDELRPGVWQRYRQVLTHRHALAFIVSQSFSFGGMFAFITASPLVYMTFFGVSEQAYPLLFGANVVAMVILNRGNVWLLGHFPSRSLLSFGQFIQTSVGLLLLLYLVLVPTPSLPTTVALVIGFVGCQSFIVANATANTIEFFPGNSGTASALLGACSFMTGAVSGAVVSFFGDGTPLPMAAVMCACAVTGVVLRLVLQKR